MNPINKIIEIYNRYTTNGKLVIKILLSLLIFFVFIIFSINITSTSYPNKIPVSITPTGINPQAQIVTISNSITPLQKAEPGITTDNQINVLSNLIKKATLPDGSNSYTFPSEITVRPDEVVTKNGVAVFEKELIPEEHDATGYALISQYTTKYGQPEKMIQGSKFYGWFIITYIYAQKGFAFLGNPNTDEVYEIHIFQPMSTEKYMQQYGQDLNPGATPPEEL